MPSRRSIATAVLALVLIGGAAAVWWQPVRQDQPRVGRNFRGDDGPVAGHRGADRRADVASLSRRRRHRPRARRRDGAAAGRRQADQRQLHRGPAGRSRPRAGEDDPITYQAAYDQAVAKKAHDEATLANARLDLERIRPAVTAPTRSRSSKPTTRKRPWRSRKRRSTRPGADRQRQGVSRLTTIVRRSPAAPASARSTRATSCDASDATGIVVITSSSRSRFCSPCRSSSSAT